MNFKLNKYPLVILLLGLLVSCNADHTGHDQAEDHNEKNTESAMDHSGHTSKKTAEVFERKELEQNEMNQIREVYRANDELYQKFVDEKYDMVATEAAKVAQAIEELENEEVKKLLEFSKKNLRDLGRDMEVETLQEAYSMISTALIHVLKTYDIGSGYNAYYCPMVKKRWIQNSEKVTQIQNPYDKSMRQCGDQETGF